MRYIFPILLLILFSCGDDNHNCNVEVTYDTPFKVQIDETYCHPNGSLFIIKNIDDSYCPCNANCVWEGEAYVEGEIISDDGTQSEFRIHEIQEQQNTQGFRISSVVTDNACDPEILIISILILPI